MADTIDKFITFGDLLVDAQAERTSINIDNMCKYWIGILDDYLWGIWQSELVLIGAYTWVGKSDIAYNVALSNAKRGKKVLMFTLEWDIYEMAYRYLQRQISRDGEWAVKTTEYRFNLKDNTDRETKAISSTHKWILDNILVFKKSKIPNVDQLIKYIHEWRDSVDMIIIDHLHYLDLSGWGSEQHELGRVMRALKTTTDIIRKPIVLVSHLRNTNDHTKDPTIFDFHWSSNIGKEGTTAILLRREDKHRIESCINNKIVDDKRYAGTKLFVRKSRIWLPEAQFSLVYDLREKHYVDEWSEISMNEDWYSIDKSSLISMGW